MTSSGVFKYNPLEDLAGSRSDSVTLDKPVRELCLQAATLFESGNLTEAIVSITRAIQMNPRLEGAFYAVAVCMARLGQVNEALKLLEIELQNPVPHQHARRLYDDALCWLQQHACPRQQITLFTVPKPFRGHSAIIQRNALKSWLSLVPRPEIIMLGNEEGVAETAFEFSVCHIPHIDTNEYGTPLVSSIFETAQNQAANELMAYVNTDIILMSGFNRTVQSVAESIDQFLLVGRRWDICIWDELDFTDPKWETSLLSKAKQQGFLHENTGIDFFAFRRGLYDHVLPFAVGRTAWDNWLIWYAKYRGATLVDATRDLPIVHQDHDYTHSTGGILNVWNGAEAQQNKKLAANKTLTIVAADSALENGVLVPYSLASNCPEPTNKDYARVKILQAREALDRELLKECTDLLDYVEHLIEEKPTNLYLLRAQLALKEGDMAMTENLIRQELELYPDNAEASRMLRFVASARAKELQLLASGEPVKPVCRLACLFLNTYYSGFLLNQYRKCPELESHSYIAQKQSLNGEFFGDSTFYSEGLRQAGWQVEDLIINCGPLQQAWAKEHKIEYANGLSVAIEQIATMKPDVVYIQDLQAVDSKFLHVIRPMVRLIAGQIATPIGAAIPFDYYDIIFSSFPHYVATFREMGLTSYYQPLAFDPRVLERITIPNYHDRPIGCSFVGGISSLHVESYRLLEMLAEKTPIDFWGYGADTLPDTSMVHNRHHGEAWGKEMFQVIANSRMTVNRHGEVAENYANNMRLFEATGCGALLITDYKDNLYELFEIGTEVVVYRSAEECAELVNYYLAHPDEAEAIALAGQRRTLRAHSYTLRMQKTAEVLERHKKYRAEAGMLRFPDRISDNHQTIDSSKITVDMTLAWQSPEIPARQRALVQHELAEMYRGNPATPFRVLAEILKPIVSNGQAVLEIGCASGYYYEVLEYLLSKQLNYTGIDYSQPMIAMAQQYYPRATFFCSDGASLFFADRQFEVVISSCVLLHVPNYRQHIFETARVAQRYVVVSRTPVCKRQATQYLKKFAYGIETVELVFNERELVYEFELNGFSLQQAIEYQTDLQNDRFETTYLLVRA